MNQHVPPPEGQSVVQVPLVGCAVGCALGDGRQLTLQTHFPLDMDDEAANRLLDRMNRMMDRQKAVYQDIPGLEAEIERDTVALAGLERDLARLDADLAMKRERLSLEAATYDEEAEKIHTAAYDEHTNSGRRGDFVLKGPSKARHDLAKASSRKLRDDIETAEKERAGAMEGIETNRRIYEGRIQRNTAELAKKKALVAG